MKFDALVLAGGGSRCLWQAGFYDVLANADRLALREVSCVSAGSCIAAMVFSDTMHEGLRYFKEITGKNPRNFYPERLLSGERPLPHFAMYRDTLLHTLDEDALGRLHRGPVIRVAIARAPARLGPRAAVAVGFGLYTLEKVLKNPVHPALGRAAGFRAEFIPMSSCATPDALADLILASSCTPPLTPIQFRDGSAALDGGLVDNVPVDALSASCADVLVLVTRRYRELPRRAGCTYVQPSERIAIDKWDYSNPQGLQDAFDLGRRDGEAFMRANTRRS
ncbi:MAG: patatin-like phospholipase family protein [Myxococcales bacterium]|nr:patatin-like phospholipase family protein [Myxococcales bacterium]